MRSAVCSGALLCAAAALAPPGACGVDNGVGLTPPMGWRHWKAFYAHIDQRIMENMMAELVRKYPVDGVPTSLAELGYIYAGLDDHVSRPSLRCCAHFGAYT